MSELLSIEQAFLGLEVVSQGLNMSAIRTATKQVANAQKNKFHTSLELSKLVLKASEWFTSDEGKQICAEEGISWTTEQFSLKVFGWQKSYYYKMLKASKLEGHVVETFQELCNVMEEQGKNPERTLEGLLKYSKQLAENRTSNANGEGGEGEGEGEGEESQVEVADRQVVLTLAYKNPNGNVSFRMNSQGDYKTTNTKEELQDVLNVLSLVISNM
jgi:hypothetical protein